MADLMLFELLPYESFQQKLIQINKNFENLIAGFLEQNKSGQARLDFSTALSRELPNWQSWIFNVVTDIKKQYEVIQLVETAKFINDIHPVTKNPIIKVQIDTPRVLTPASIKNSNNIMNVRGPAVWKSLHTYALSWDGNVDAHTAFIEDTTKQIACGECKQFWLNYKKETPPPTDSKENFFAWTVELHNKVNIKLSKPTMELADAIELYKS